MTTVSPSAARRSAMAAPMPREAPVTIATLLPLFDIVFSFLCALTRLNIGPGRMTPRACGPRDDQSVRGRLCEDRVSSRTGAPQQPLVSFKPRGRGPVLAGEPTHGAPSLCKPT